MALLGRGKQSSVSIRWCIDCWAERGAGTGYQTASDAFLLSQAHPSVQRISSLDSGQPPPAHWQQEGTSMNPNTALPLPVEIVYPESDGLPMSDNTRQFRWIVVLFGNLAA